MRWRWLRSLVVVLVILGIAAPASAQLSVPKVTTVTPITGAATGTTSFASAVSAGQAIVVGVSTFTSPTPRTVSSISCGGDSFAQFLNVVFGGVPEQRIEIWLAYNSAGSCQNVQVNLSGTADFTTGALAVAGVPTTNPKDGTGNTNTGSSQNPSVSCTASVPDSIIIGVFAHDSSNRTLTENAGFTMAVENEGGSANMSFAMEYQIYTSSGAKTIGGAIGTSSVGWGIGCAGLIKDTGGAAPAAQPSMMLLGTGVAQ